MVKVLGTDSGAMQLTANTAAKPSYNLDEAVVKLPNQIGRAHV